MIHSVYKVDTYEVVATPIALNGADNAVLEPGRP